MSITIKKIAEGSGVSRGTVDRVLNNRGKTNPETEKKVRACAKALGYKPNIAGKALAAKKKRYVIGVVISSEGNPFFDDVIKEIQNNADDYKDYGISITIKTMKGYNVSHQLQLIDEIRSEISGLIITPIDDVQIRDKINELSKAGVGIVTLNTDIKDCEKISYVGTNYYSGGKIAAGILALLKPLGANIGIIQGSNKLYGHNQRLLGFKEELKENFCVSEIYECQDDDILAYEQTTKMLKTNIDAIFIVAAGVYGVCRAVEKGNRDITIISFDEIETTVDMLNKGIIKATISQQPKFQGKKAMEIMFEYLISNEKPLANEYIIENQIKIKQNFNLE